MRLAFLATAALVFAAGSPAAAADRSAMFLTSLFLDACAPNIGQPAKTAAWAQAHRLPAITSPTALETFAGRGFGAAAWAAPTKFGHFALAIRGGAQACAVWAEAADPATVQANFQQLIGRVQRTGLRVSLDRNTVQPTPLGRLHTVEVNVTQPNAPTSLEFLMLTVERKGGAYQASIQAGRVGPHR